MCACVFVLFCSVEWSYRKRIITQNFWKECLHVSADQHVYSVCKESWATTVCGVSQWGHSMDSSLCVCCEYSPLARNSVHQDHNSHTLSSAFNAQSLLMPFFFFLSFSRSLSGLSTVTTYRWYQKEPSKICRHCPTCEWQKNTHLPPRLKFQYFTLPKYEKTFYSLKYFLEFERSMSPYLWYTYTFWSPLILFL